MHQLLPDAWFAYPEVERRLIQVQSSVTNDQHNLPKALPGRLERQGIVPPS